METLYCIPVLNLVVEVYGEPENAWYEWRVLDDTNGRRVLHDSKNQGYGMAAVALRDGLIFATEKC